MATVNSVLKNSMEEIFGLIADKFSGETFDADDLMILMTGDISTSDSETEAKKKKKKSGGKAKKIKDPNMPKRPPSSYFIFCNETRNTKSNGTAKYSKNELTESWKDLDEDNRELWTNKASVLREKYAKDVEIYKQSKMAADDNSDSE